MFEVFAQYLRKNALLTDTEIEQFHARAAVKSFVNGNICYRKVMFAITIVLSLQAVCVCTA